MDTECTDVGTGLAGHPEHGKLSLIVKLKQLALVDSTDTELTLDGGDERWSLEEGSGESLERAGKLGLTTRKLSMQSQNADILLSCALLALHKSSRAVDADNETSGNLWVKGSGVTGTLDTQDSLKPCDDFVGGWVRGLVEVDDTRRDV